MNMNKAIFSDLRLFAGGKYWLTVDQNFVP